YRPSYNVSPGACLPVVRKAAVGEEAAPAIHCMKWGLVPSFTKKTDKPDHYKMFNARSESIKEKTSFRRLLPTNRCLVAVEGYDKVRTIFLHLIYQILLVIVSQNLERRFYEWKKDGSKKQPYYIHFEDQRPLVFAALYDSWSNSEG
ncbi:putative SOS response-associated peptidase YoaM, partial [Ananas comosus]